MVNKMNKPIYLDHSATTPVDPAVLKAMLPYFSDKFGNPSSVHGFGQEAQAAVDQARITVAEFLNCAPAEVVFTSGATEADNLAINGVTKALREKFATKLHIITLKIEHPAVLEPFHELARQGFDVTFLPVQKNGVVRIEDFKKAVRDNTVLVSLMYVNSEVGSIQPIREIGKLIEKINEGRPEQRLKTRTIDSKLKPLPLYFHTDAVQAVNFLNCDTQYLHVDLFSLSGHKIYGPKGIGALFVKSGTPIEAVQLGGHHEHDRRSGTLNVTGIVGLAKAVALLTEKNKTKNNKKIAIMRDNLIAGLKRNIPHIRVNTDITISTPAHANISFIGAEGESILIALDLAGIAVSTGSACASTSLKASHVLLAMGIPEEIAHNSIRFTLGKNNNLNEIKRLINVLPPIIKRLRQMAPKL